MKEKVLEYRLLEYQSITELPESDRNLVLLARNAAKDAYAPYSGFRVGAALLLENSEIVTGSNQENAAYPSGLCAERTALFYASAKFPKVAVKTMAVTTLGNGTISSDFAKPCGACRQVMAEYEDLAGKPIRIILDGAKTVVVIDGVDALLPLRFKGVDLGK
jgi:cytidine deaminase